jgi:hypothetical protein
MAHRIDPGAMTGTYETTDTAGPDARYGAVRDVTPVFDMAAANDLAFALKSMDPADMTPPNLVQTSPGLTVNRGDPEADRQRIIAAADRNMIHLLRQGWIINADGVPVPPPRNDADTWRNISHGMGTAVQVEPEPTGHAG